MRSLTVFSPAKTNFMLAVTGRRPDGFHDLVSVVAPLSFGDTITLTRTPGVGDVELRCSDPALPADERNLAVRAARAFQAATGIRDGCRIELTKRIPTGAGLGGGSSNAVAVLRGLNTLHDEPLATRELAVLAASIGSDCPLFLAGGPCVIRGRGEHVATFPPQVRERFAQARLLLFKPEFGVATPWAYARLAATPHAYLPAPAAEARLETWVAEQRPLSELLFNSFEPIVHSKYLALAVLADEIRRVPGVAGVLLSGSGSASFALLPATIETATIAAYIRERLGPHTFIQEASVG